MNLQSSTFLSIFCIVQKLAKKHDVADVYHKEHELEKDLQFLHILAKLI